MGNKVLLTSAALICKSNAVLSSRLVKYFTGNGYAVTDKAQEADIIVVNTCGFNRERVDHSKNIFLSKMLRDRKKASRVLSVGCLNKIDRVALESCFEDLIIIDDLSDLDSLINAGRPFNTFKSAYFDNSIFDHVQWHPTKTLKLVKTIYFSMARFLKRHRKNSAIISERLEKIKQEDKFENKIYVEIGKGCASNCSYCVIKKARGNPLSRPVGDVVADIREIYREGMVLNLVADDCGSYGFDNGKSLFELMEVINQEFPGIPVDICYVNPLWLEKFPDQYLDMFKRFNINSVNVTLQSGSDRIIQLMNRKYHANNILDIIRRLQSVSPSTMFWSHFIIDYPSETWGEFFLTLKAARFFHFYHFFIYSAPGKVVSRENTWCVVRRGLKTAMMLLRVHRQFLKL